MLSRKQPSSRGWIGSIAVAAILLVAAFGVVSNIRFFTDNFNYYSYRPDTTIESFVLRAGMSEKGKFFFYASQPALETAQSFNTKCGRTEEKTAILGCYTGQKIYIYDIRDERLTGVRATTAAHEMLHAAYDRLTVSKKEEVNRLLEAEYNALKDDQELKNRMDFYNRTQPGERNNELHSIIATEISTINPELENYYRQYFTDRSSVVALHNEYESVFTALQNRADELKRQIDLLDAVVKDDTATYNQEADAITDDVRAFNQKAQQGEFSSQSEFNIERQRLVSRADLLDNLRAKINTATQDYNRLVTELNGIATQTEDLNRSIDSSLAPAPNL